MLSQTTDYLLGEPWRVQLFAPYLGCQVVIAVLRLSVLRRLNRCNAHAL